VAFHIDTAHPKSKLVSLSTASRREKVGDPNVGMKVDTERPANIPIYQELGQNEFLKLSCKE